MTWSVPQEHAGLSFEIGLYDIAGRRVSTVATGIAKAGRFTQELSFNSANGPLRNGVFFIRLRIGGQVPQRTAILVR